MNPQRHAFSLQLTERCNLACDYCYVLRRRQPDGVDCTPEFCTRFVDFVLRESAGRAKITFFGGEPLLRPDLIRHTVAYGKAAARDHGKVLEFHVVTNATLLDDATGDFIAAEGIGLEVSLDGPEEVHDRHRRFVDGAPSFHQVYGKLLRFVERHPCHPVAIFSVITSADALPWLQALCRSLEVNGFTYNPARLGRGEESCGGCHGAMPEAFRARIDGHREAFLQGETDADGGMNDQLACILGAGESHRCEVGINATLTTRTGDIYPCPFFVGHADQVIGNIASGFDPVKLKPYVVRAAAGLMSCAKCQARRVCGDGCAFAAYEQSGAIDTPARDACAVTRAYARRLEASALTLAARKPEQLLETVIRPGAPTAYLTETSKPHAGPPHSFVIRLTGHCNLACDYCYDKHNGSAGDHLKRTTARVIARRIVESPCEEPLVCLFGGEPLLNWPAGEFLIEEISRQAGPAGKRPFFHLTTNATLVTPRIAAFIADHAVTVQVSVDGLRESHDSHRRGRDGGGSYEAMLRGVELLRGANPDAKIDGQAVLTPGNVDRVAIAKHLRELGFRRISFLVAGWESHTGVTWSDADMAALAQAQEAFFPFFVESALRGEPEVDMGFAALVAAEPQGPTGLCECGSGQIYFDTQARMHRCPQLYAAGRHCDGPGRTGQAVVAAGSNIEDDCRACWAWPRCRGGCMVRNQRCPWIAPPVATDRTRAWCDLLRADFARAILAYKILDGRNPASIEKLKAVFTG